MQRTIRNPLYNDIVTFIETSAETNGKYSLMEVTLAPRGGNMQHYHTAFTETFQVMKGFLGLRLKDKSILLQPGENYTVQKNQIHYFLNPDNERITFRVVFKPGHEGMENTLRIAYGLAADGLTNKKGIPKNLYAAALIMEMSNSYPTGLLSLLKPLLSFLAHKAKKNGTEKKLIEKYCSKFKHENVLDVN